jgi:hypothetical protein
MKFWLIPIALAVAGAARSAENCEALRAQIEAKIGATGATNFTVTTVDTNAPASGQVVGSCELGSKKIVYRREGGPAPGGAAPRAGSGNEDILTECKDGTESVGGNCRK